MEQVLSFFRQQEQLLTKSSLMCIALVLISLMAFNEHLLELVNRWSSQDEYSHGYLIPLISLWFIWERLDAFKNSTRQKSYLSYVFILLALVCLVLSELSAIYIIGQFGFIISLVGIALTMGGMPFLRLSIFPITFLLFAIPLPHFVDAVLSAKLQLISSELGTAFIRMFGIPVFLEGNIIDLGDYKLQVVEACSGLRYLFPLISLGFLAAYLFKAPLWQKGVILLSTIPITIIMNSFRIGMIGFLVNGWGSEMADGFLHYFEGWIIFMVCAAILVFEIWLFTLFNKEKSFQHAFGLPIIKPIKTQGKTTTAISLNSISVLILVSVGMIFTIAVDVNTEYDPDRKRFVSFPRVLEDWQGVDRYLTPDIVEALKFNDYIQVDYRNPDNEVVNFYVAYYDNQRKGESPHSPQACIPGGGWNISTLQTIPVAVTYLNEPLKVNRVMIQKEERKQIVYYWFDQRGRKMTNEYVVKWHLLEDALFMNRTDGALVRFVTPVYPNETEADADKRLVEMINHAKPFMSDYIPS